ncbi:hypothetical protein BpHYR1_034447 [Brachionus plicatilis]|uniref:Protein sleepless n=1 Tax=Brachionus plicatilis TaxID=10195 RepID=A0A3M7SCC0_BRAPC|nr:hypothetical protein BpHYR1_034447 [Brachionus plicatilis]
MLLVIISVLEALIITCQSQNPSTQPAAKEPNPLSPPSNNYYNYLRCWRCDYDDTEQCVKSFDFTKHKHEPCDGKCLKAFEKTHARTKEEIAKAQMTPTIRKCVSLKEIQSLNNLGINTNNGCHDIRTTKRKHKLYCFCENDLCNKSSKSLMIKKYVFIQLIYQEKN